MVKLRKVNEQNIKVIQGLDPELYSYDGVIKEIEDFIKDNLYDSALILGSDIDIVEIY
jgi:hypothetical protein